MAPAIKNVMVMGAGGLVGTQIVAKLQEANAFHLSVLSRKSSKATFPSSVKEIKVDDDYPVDQLIEAFKGQDALVSALPGSIPLSINKRIIDAAIAVGVKRFVPSEFGNNTCAAAADLVPLYAEKVKVMAHLRSTESKGLTWTAIHSGQFFDWGLETGWLNYHLADQRVTVYDSGDKLWSTTTLATVAAAVTKALLKPEETRNKALFVASFTVSQSQVLGELETATGAKWKVQRMTSEAALERARQTKDDSERLKLLVLMLLYAEDKDRGANFEKDGLLSNELLGLPVEHLSEVVARVVKQQGS